MNPPTVLSVRIKNDKEGPQTGDVVLNGSAINEWLSGNEYDTGDVVVYDGQFYQSKEKQTAGTSFDYDKWTQIGIPDIIVPEFQTNTYYKQNEVISYNSKLYKAKTAFTSSNTFYDDDWDSLTGANYTFTSEDRTVAISIDGETIDFSVSSYVDNIKTSLENQLSDKVNKEDGKGLSTNDYTTEEKTKLSNLAGIFEIGDNLVLDADGKLNAGFTVSFDASLDKTSTNGVQNKVIAEAIEDLQDDVTSLSSRITTNTNNISTNTTNISQNASDIAQLQQDLTDQSSLLNTKVDKVDGKELSSNDYTDADQTKLNSLEKIYNIGARLTLDPGTNTLSANDQSTVLESETGQSTTSGMTQKAITDAIADAVAGGVGTLAPVATSGSYNDLIDTPDIDTTLSSTSTNAVQNRVIKSALDQKADDADLSTVAKTGDYEDLNNLPSIPARVSDLADGADVVKTADLSTVAFSGDYDDLTGTPTIGNGTIKLYQSDGVTEVMSFSTNQNAAQNFALPALAADLELSINSSTYVITAQLKDQDGNVLGTAKTIDLPLESVVVSGRYDSSTKKVVLTLKDGSEVDFSIADLVSGLQSEITSTNKLSADLVDDSSSTHKFTTAAEKTKLAGITAGAEVNVQSDWNEVSTTSDAYIKNKPTIDTALSTTSTNAVQNKAVKTAIDTKQTKIEEYTTGKTYAVGDICILDDSIYCCLNAIASAPATMNDSDWEQIGGKDTAVITLSSVTSDGTWTSNKDYTYLVNNYKNEPIVLINNNAILYVRLINNSSTFYIITQQSTDVNTLRRITLNSDGTTTVSVINNSLSGTLTIEDAEGTSLGTFNGSANTTITLPESFDILTNTEIDSIWENA